MTNLFNKFKKSLFLIHFWLSLTILETKKLIQVEENTQTIRTIGWTDKLYFIGPFVLLQGYSQGPGK